MLCLFVTGVLKPEAPRIGSIGSNIQLPRTLPTWPTVGAIGGGFVGLLIGAVVGAIIGGSTGVFVALSFAVLFGYGGVSVAS